ncbi:MAG: hypothetical protein DI629_03990 [Mesorhizobium amorphae]|nr:MAG: hypothetical protein DI629_03990 [Mesorhizobium amorphae]
MKLQMLSIAALALSIAAPAIAQEAATGASPRLADQTMMAPFYSDEGMTTLRSGAEFDSAFSNLSSQDREAIMNECQNVNTERQTFCDSFKERNGKM